MSDRARLALGVLCAASALAGVAVLCGAGLWIDLDDAERRVVAGVLAAHAATAVALALLALAALAIAAHRLVQTYVGAPLRVAEEARLILTTNAEHRVAPRGTAQLRALTEVINEFAARHGALEREVAVRVDAATARLEEEKNRLAALMSELTQSVLVCNIEGRILLYNQRARQLFLAADRPSDGLVGLGRSIFGVIERNHIAHALDALRVRVRRGDSVPVANVVTATQSGRLIRARMAPVLGAAGGEEREITGYVLTLEDVTREIEADHRRDAVLRSLTEGSRSQLASIRAAAETLLLDAEMEPWRQRSFLQIVSEEARALSERVSAAAADFDDNLSTQLALEEILAADLVQAARRRIEQQLGIPVSCAPVEESLWLNVESYALLQGLSHIARRVRERCAGANIGLAVDRSSRHAHLDVVWSGAEIEVETLSEWETEPFSASGQESHLTLRELSQRHGGESWYQHDRVSGNSRYRMLLPAAQPAAAPAPAPAAEGRPEFYDFDLFLQSRGNPKLDERPLAELACTVFDTETTGLDPSGGDEIVAIGAVRIVNGRLLQNELFDQLVDPQRPISASSVAVHGIESGMLEGQPRIAEVLPAFARFCEDTVLVAHNAAFDMRFLQIKEAATGIRFTQPVLDTLLLSAVAHPTQEAHTLEAIAERLGVHVVGRHTALGDALVTGEVFLKLLPLLAESGVKTLGQAREAAQRTYYARIKY
jgi:DNA polymerase III subunit epsilon